MKWRLTGRFLLSVVTIVIIVLIVNLLILIATIVVTSQRKAPIEMSPNAEPFVRNFAEHIIITDGVPSITKDGITQLKEHNAYIQLLDKNGTVLNSVNAPDTLPKHYSPVELITAYKYEQELNVTKYIYAKEQFSYLIGITDANIFRYTAVLNFPNIMQNISSYLLSMLIADVIITIVIAFFFGRSLTKPLTQILNQIQFLKMRKFQQMPKRKGIYKEVFQNLNDVATELAAHEKERAHLEKVRNEWISNISHDMKTPLASIRGYAEILCDADSKEEMTIYAEVIERQSRHIDDLLNDLNLTMRLRSQQLPLNKQPINITTLCRELIIELLNEPKYSDYTMTLQAPEEAIICTVDAHFIQRALLNFMYNAIHHNEKKINLDIHVAIQNNRAYIQIVDNGKGIAEEDIAHIFERYYRGTNTEATTGTGLGTAIARDIIIAHDGQVWITSTIDEGTSIHILLPLVETYNA